VLNKGVRRMPHLQYCNRYWYISGDELFLPAIISVVIRIFWTILLIIAGNILYHANNHCNYQWIVDSYLVSSLIVFFFFLVIEIGIIFTSVQGSLIETEKRQKSLSILLTMKLILTFLQGFSGLLGVILLGFSSSNLLSDTSFAKAYHGCQFNVTTEVLIGIVAVSQFTDACLLFCCCSYCFSLSKEHYAADVLENCELATPRSSISTLPPPITTSPSSIFSSSSPPGSPPSSPRQKRRKEEASNALQLWQTRCQSLMTFLEYLCCLTYNNQSKTAHSRTAQERSTRTSDLSEGLTKSEGYNQVAKVLTTFFHHDGFLDVVPSDILAGFLLVRVQQRKYNFDRCKTLSSSKSFVLSIPSSPVGSPSRSRSFSSYSHDHLEKCISNDPFLKNGHISGNGCRTAPLSLFSLTSIDELDGDDERFFDGEDDDGEEGDIEEGRRKKEEIDFEKGVKVVFKTPSPKKSVSITCSDDQLKKKNLFKSSFYNIPPSSSFGACSSSSVLDVSPSQRYQGHSLYEMDNWFTASVYALTIYKQHLFPSVFNNIGNGRSQQKENEAVREEVEPSSKSNFLELNTKSCFSFFNGNNNNSLQNDLQNSELVYFSNKNDTVTQPFGIFLDHSKKWIVIALRGTVSLEDCITNALCEPVEVSLESISFHLLIDFSLSSLSLVN
jgi:hypothetical protein